ncbi:TetR/AcrR family transcriptional regulator [Haloarcula sp. GH36]|uniref:TetR/AcrR family transcriptional regulator n=1 Tax=Haloarcula montana TaxID=3111776 RepID=UPI002D78E90F|nr:TetR/AcrR family transcriptional regulator [Haloarcula sp. GH36]
MSNGDTADDIMGATYRALCAHGYADLTMQDIADESERSKAALHYHYDSKHELLCAFLEYLYDGFVERTGVPDDGTPRERLLDLIDDVLDKPDGDDQEFGTAILEIRAQAPYEPGFRERLTRFDDYLIDELTAIIEAGIEDGSFDPELEPDDTAQFIVTVLTGAATERVTTGRPVACTKQMLTEYVETHLLADPQEVEA